MPKTRKTPKGWEGYSLKDGEIKSILLKDAQSRWINTKELIPLYNCKLLAVTSSGCVVPATYHANERVFTARFRFGYIRPFIPIYWRLFPDTPLYEYDESKTFTVINQT